MDTAGILAVLGTSVVKFVLAAAVSYGFNHTFWETVLLLSIGGAAGTVAFYLAGVGVLKRLHARAVRNRDRRIAKGLTPKRVFTRSNRFIVRVKRSYGLLGLAIMPPLLSVPITALIAAKYFHHDRRTLPVLLTAIACWSLVLSMAWGFLR
ncbi:MAG: hypothetical protein IPK70_08415 [Flavobacteriales bacterium]|jgi:hypothetical protein|nr:hypothetical protein [Flavobacteriales bacterium]